MNKQPMVVTDEIREAIARLVSKLESKKMAAAKMGISDVYLNDILKKTRVIGELKWDGMLPALRPYLPSYPPAAAPPVSAPAPPVSAPAPPVVDPLLSGIMDRVKALSIVDQSKLLIALDSGKCPHCPDPPPAPPPRRPWGAPAPRARPQPPVQTAVRGGGQPRARDTKKRLATTTSP
jgi:hypothetical protein